MIVFHLFFIKLLIGTVLHLTAPRTLFPEACSTLLYSSDGQLLGARIAPDGQWRFPPADSLPGKFVTCLLTYEDKRFFRHSGVDPVAIVRAMRINLSRGKVVSGGSTITMQLARIARGNRDRTLYEKMVETGYALLLETVCGKHQILNLYASHAPFGGNVIGIETAAWRYFGRSAADLSWAESATLAVLPNSPALIHPGRNRARLKAKRDKLLTALKERGILDETEYGLSLLEPLPEAPVPLPDEAPHLLERLAADAPGTRITTSVNRMLQRQTQEIVNRYARDYASNHIHNLAALIADAETGEVLAYAGNVTFKADARKGNQVDIITSPRSTGSILKPFLYAAMLHDGLLLPGTLVSDVPPKPERLLAAKLQQDVLRGGPGTPGDRTFAQRPAGTDAFGLQHGAVHVAAEKGGHDHAALFRRALRGFADPGRRRRDVMGPHRHVCFTGAYARTLPDLQRAV